MKTRSILSGAAAVLYATMLASAQIAPQGGIQQRPPQPTTQQPRAQPTEGPMTTLAGCLYHEESIAGRSPNVAEKAGVGEDYILADATPAREQNRTPDRPIADAGQPPSATAGLATGRMYKVTKIDDKRLKDFVGKRVEVTGAIKPDNDVRSADGVRPDKRSADDARPSERPANFENLPNIEGTSIREVAGATCPARPS
jgi:hypothetical protein